MVQSVFNIVVQVRQSFFAKKRLHLRRILQNSQHMRFEDEILGGKIKFWGLEDSTQLVSSCPVDWISVNFELKFSCVIKVWHSVWKSHIIWIFSRSTFFLPFYWQRPILCHSGVQYSKYFSFETTFFIAVISIWFLDAIASPSTYPCGSVSQ